MSGVLCDKRVPPHVKGKIHNMIVQPAMLYGMEAVPVTSSHVKKLEVTEMKMCRWACGHSLRDHTCVRNENIKARLKVESIAERCRKARLRWFGHVKRREHDYVGRKTLEMVPPGRRKRGRDGWNVSTETWQPSERRKTRTMTALAGGELCLPQRPHNQVGPVPARYVRQSQICPQLDMSDKNDKKTHDMSDKARCVRQKFNNIAWYVRQMCLTKMKTKCNICLTGHNYTSKRLEWLLNLLVPIIHPFYSTHNTIYLEIVPHVSNYMLSNVQACAWCMRMGIISVFSGKCQQNTK